MKKFKKVIAVYSAKGGVGKSTIACNVAVSLSLLKYKVALLDADVYGPSIPTLLNLHEKVSVDKAGCFIPLLNHGIACMSMGFLANGPIAWRGLLTNKAINDMIFNTAFDSPDVLVIDLPPGTGDTHLTIFKNLLIDSCLLVSTPQDVSKIDTKKSLLLLQKFNIHVLGLVENMTFFTCPHCHSDSDIFTNKSDLGIPTIAKLPIVADVSVASDEGIPIVIKHPNSLIAKEFMRLANFIADSIGLKG